MTQLIYGRRPLPSSRSNAIDVLGAAFRQENDVVNLVQLAQTVRPPVEENFDLEAAAAALPDPTIWDRHGVTLARAQSQQEFDGIRRQIEQEDRDRQMLAQAGWGGFAAGMVAGTFSPTMFIPLIGQARGVRGVAQAFGLAALGATAAEVPLLLNQETRTLQEGFAGIAAGTVLGGLLGSTAVFLRRADFEAIARELEPEVQSTARGFVGRVEGEVQRFGEAPPLREVDVPVRPIVQEVNWLPPGADRSWTRLRGETQIGGQEMRFDLPEIPEDNVRFFLTEAEPSPRIEDARIVDGTVEYVNVPKDSSIADLGEVQRADVTPVQRESTAGAQQTPFMQIPTVETVDPTTGRITYEPVMSAEEALTMDPALRVGEFAARINPIARAAMQWDAPQRSLVTARNALKLSDGGVSWRGSSAGIAVDAAGTVESRQQYYRALQGRAYQRLYEAYGEYLRDGAKQTLGGRVVQRARVEFNSAPAGKLTFQEFSAAVTEALNRGDTSPISQVAQVAQYWRKEVFAKVLEAAHEAAEEWGAERLFKELQFDQQHSYMTHVYSPAKVAADQPGFIAAVADYVERGMRVTWERRIEKAILKGEAEADTADLLTLNADAARELLDANNEVLRAAKQAPDPAVERINELRAEARDLVAAKVEEFEKQIEEHRGTFVKVGEDTRYLHQMSRKELKRVAEEAVADERQALLDEIDMLEGQLQPEQKTSRDRLRALRQQNAVLRRSFGHLEVEQARALDRIEANEDLNIAAFEKVVTATQRFMRDAEKVTPERLEAEMQRLQMAWDKAWKAASRGEKQLDDLEEQLLFEGYSGKGALEESMRQTGRQMRADRAFDRLSKAMLQDTEALMAELRSRVDTAIAYVNRVNGKRSERNALLRQRVKALEPEQALRMADEIRSRADARFAALDEALAKAGADTIDSISYTFSFSNAAQQYATELANNIMGNITRIAQIDSAVGLRGPMKGRYLNIPYHIKKQWLEEDAEKVLDKYVRTMGSDIELYRAFGDRSGGRAVLEAQMDLQRIREELAEGGASAKVLAQHDRAAERRLRELEGSIERIRGLRGMPDNPHALSYRLGRFVLNSNVATMMGSAALSSIPDAARAVFAHGLTRTFRDSWMPLIRGMVAESQGKLNKAQMRELQYMGIGIDSFIHQRARNMLDILEPMTHSTKMERGMEWMAQKTPVLAGLSAWTDSQKLAAGMATLARFTRIVEDAAAGKAVKADVKYLALNGIDERMLSRIAQQLEEFGTKYDGLTLPNVADWTDYQAMRVWMAALAREDARLIVSPGLEKPLWLDGSMLGRILGQFRSFTMASNSKMLVASLQSRDRQAVYAVQAAVGSMALGALSYYLWAMTSSERSREEMRNASIGHWLDQALYRSGLLGVFEEARTIGQEFPLTRPFLSFSGDELAGRRANSALGAVFGPSFGKAETFTNFLMGLDEPTEGTVRQARRMIPWQNVFWLRQGFDAVEKAISSTFNLPESRR